MIGCEFGLCSRTAEFAVTVAAPEESEGVARLRVCGLHVTPVVTWGVAEPGEPEIRLLHHRDAA